MKNKPAAALIILLFHVLALLGYHVFGYIGHYGFDDLHYARLSNDLLHGVVDFSDHFTFRFTLLALTALSYKILGISDVASSLPALAITLVILVVIYRILKDKGNIALSAGLSLTLFSTWFIFYSGKLMPDIYIALPVVAAVAIVYHQRHVQSTSRQTLYAFLFGVVLLVGFMAKETIVLFAPLLLYYLVSGLVVKRNRTFWISALVSGFLMLLVYFLVIRLLTGDWLQRFMAIAGNSYLNLCSYDQQSTLILLRRISYEFFSMSLNQSLLTGYLFLVPLFFRRNLSGFLKQNEFMAFYAVSALILLLSSNFMSISLTSYSPMCLDPRHYLFLIPVAAIPAALVISGYVREKSFKTGILLSLICLFYGQRNLPHALPAVEHPVYPVSSGEGTAGLPGPVYGCLYGHPDDPASGDGQVCPPGRLPGAESGGCKAAGRSAGGLRGGHRSGPEAARRILFGLQPRTGSCFPVV